MYWHSNITHGKNASHNKETHKDNKKETEKKSGFWVAEFQMDCDRAHGPQQWFEFKPIRRLHKTQVVNFDPVQFAPLVDTVSGVAYFSAWDGGNYWGQCGRINTVELGEAGTKVS